MGKTTVTFGKRFKEHWSKNTSVKEHLGSCDSQPTPEDGKIQFLENVWDRGKHSLSEREYLWNRRFKGDINVFWYALSSVPIIGTESPATRGPIRPYMVISYDVRLSFL